MRLTLISLVSLAGLQTVSAVCCWYASNGACSRGWEDICSSKCDNEWLSERRASLSVSVSSC